MTSALAVRWPGAHERHIASGRAARKPRKPCCTADSTSAPGFIAETTCTASACSGGGTSVAQPTSSRPTAIASAVPRRNRSSCAPRISVPAAEPVVVEFAVAREAAHDRDRDAAELALHQIARGRELVRDRDLGDVRGRCRRRRCARARR